MFASIIQFKFGNRNAKQSMFNKSDFHSFNQTFIFGHSAYSLTQQLLTGRANVECLINAVALKLKKKKDD